MAKTRAYAAKDPKSPLAPFEIDRRAVGPRDVAIEIDYCGICHSDIHQARDEWGNSIFPMVPGHEIVGRVTRVGAEVKRFKAGDRVGVGCMVDSCRTCPACAKDLEQFCAKGAAFTYNGTEMDRKTPTYGGYSTDVVVDEKFVLAIPAGRDPAGAAPLLCAGITTYSPLRHWKVKAAPFAQNCSRSFLQGSHSRQASTMQPTPAMSPGLNLFTWAPTCFTRPMISWPGTMGKVAPPHSSRTWWMSEWQTPQ